MPEHDLYEVLTSDWVIAKDTEQRIRQKLRERRLGDVSRRFRNEVRDALDHLYRVSSATTRDEQEANINSIAEHLRRATVESLEFLVEETLARIRPVSVRWLAQSWRRTDLRFTIWIETVRKLLLVKPRYSRILLRRIGQGKKHLAEARRAKGSDMRIARDGLYKALAAFEEAEEEIYAGKIRARLYQLALGAIFFVLGIGVTLLLGWVFT